MLDRQALTFRHAEEPLVLATYEGWGESIHPDISCASPAVSMAIVLDGQHAVFECQRRLREPVDLGES
jgi:hypothetical protein